MQQRTVAVIGAGLAGLMCGSALARSGLAVTVFNAGHHAGGRVATRRVKCHDPEGDEHDLVLDYGAQAVFIPKTQKDGSVQYFDSTISSLGFVKIDGTDDEQEKGVVQRRPRHNEIAFIPINGIANLPVQLANRLMVIEDVKINSLARSSHGDWTLYTTDNNGSFGTYDTVMLATHIDAAWRILDASRIQLRDMPGEGLAKRSSPIWAIMAAWRGKSDGNYFGMVNDQNTVFEWLHLRQQGKNTMTAVAHTTALYAQKRYDTPKSEVENDLLPHLEAICQGYAPLSNFSNYNQRIFIHAHRWGAAVPLPAAVSKTSDFVYDPLLRIGVCGDYFRHYPATCYGAMYSGQALASAIFQHESN